jgi:hypothetical protein
MKIQLVSLVAVLLSGCGGGSDSNQPTVPPVTQTIGGTVSAFGVDKFGAGTFKDESTSNPPQKFGTAIFR